jgi:hypothetical protein
MKQKSYSFKSTWRIQAPEQLVEKSIDDIERWPVWWTDLESVAVLHFDEAIIGNQVGMQWRARGGYRLKLELQITNHDARKITFNSKGDLVGQGICNFAVHNSLTIVEILWNVKTTKLWMNLLAPVLRPVFISNHASLMRQGETGLNRYLHRQLGSPADE